MIRLWTILVLLRRKGRTIAELARLVQCHERTVRRDLLALKAVPFPVFQVDGVWMIAEIKEWPVSEPTPIAMVRRA